MSYPQKLQSKAETREKAVQNTLVHKGASKMLIKLTPDFPQERVQCRGGLVVNKRSN
jgi:hypothetical protein